ncbi:hypothetical protein JXA12_04800 [Candidatus Woesearchaeota archaeon]|nr:hypothetical protein [Candidatus Woesearchaeota archaeon]
MKHNLSVTALLVGIFLVAQVAGLFLIGESMQDVTCDVLEDVEECRPVYADTAVGERPQTEGFGSFLYIIVGVGVATAVLLLIIRFGKTNIWRAWFFLAVWVASAIALGVVLPSWLAWLLGLVLAGWKLWRPNIVVYNVAEILMYAGIAVLLVPILDVWWTLALLLLISAYDMVAVWKSKHMVSMAKFITSSNTFAGLLVPYGRSDGVRLRMHRGEAASRSLKKGSSMKNAILGGGDIAFPLLFAGAVLQARVVELVGMGVPFAGAVTGAFVTSIIVAIGATMAIAGLFLFAKKDTFYPAMPFVTIGCLVGWAVTLLV